MNKISGTIFSLLLVFGFSACGQEETYDESFEPGIEQEGLPGEDMGIQAEGLGDWDADLNNQIDRAEFTTGFGEAGIYDEWDIDANQELSEDEFYSGVYDLWDENDDALLDESEWNNQANNWFAEAQYNLTDWDTDGEEGLTEEEFVNGFRETGLYTQWNQNQDNLIDENEFAEGTYELFDQDQSDFLDENEWNQTSSALGIDNTDTGAMQPDPGAMGDEPGVMENEPVTPQDEPLTPQNEDNNNQGQEF